MLELLGLDARRRPPVESLSLGRGRLVEIGRALMTEPKLLLLDEPSSGLDRSETRGARRDAARRCSASSGIAILLVEHDVEMVRSFVERVFVLDFGTRHRGGPDRRGARRRRGAQGLPRRPRVSTTSAAAEPRATVAAARAARRRRGLRAVPGAVRRVVRGRPRARARAARLQRRRQDHGRPRVLRADQADAGHVLLRRRRRHRAHGRTSSPGSASCTRPRAGRCSRRSRSRRTSTLTFRRSRGRAGVAAALDEAYELFPGSASGASRSPARSRAASSACSSLARVLVEKPTPADRRRAVAGPGADHRRRGVRTLGDDPRRGHHAAASSSSTCTTRSTLADDASCSSRARSPTPARSPSSATCRSRRITCRRSRTVELVAPSCMHNHEPPGYECFVCNVVAGDAGDSVVVTENEHALAEIIAEGVGERSRPHAGGAKATPGCKWCCSNGTRRKPCCATQAVVSGQAATQGERHGEVIDAARADSVGLQPLGSRHSLRQLAPKIPAVRLDKDGWRHNARAH